MIRELSSSQLLDYKKLLTTVLNGIDSAILVRSHLIDYDSVSKYEQAKIDCLNDPEPYFHLKLFDCGIGIVRLYSPVQWCIRDVDKKYFHFTIRLYNFSPSDTYKLICRSSSHYSDYGEFLDLDDCMKYFYMFITQIFEKKFKLQPFLFAEDIF